MAHSESKIGRGEDVPQKTSQPTSPSLAETIEVAALLGPSVVAVKHLLRAKRANTAWMLLPLGGLLLGLSALAFGAGVRNAAQNRSAYDQHVRAQKLRQDFRPAQLSQGYETMALAGGLGGLILVTLGLIRIRDERDRPEFRLGTLAGVDFPTTGAGCADFALVAASDRGGFALHFAEGWTGELAAGGRTSSFADLIESGQATASRKRAGVFQLPISAGAQIQVSTPHNSFLVRAVARPRRQGLSVLAAVDSGFLAYLSGTTMAVLGLMVLFDTHFEEEKTLYSDYFENDPRLEQIKIKPTLAAQRYHDPIAVPVPGPPGGTGTAMAMAEGRMGTRDSARASGQYTIKHNELEPQLAARDALHMARDAGLLGVLRQHRGGDFASITGTFDSSSGYEAENAYGGLLGNQVGEMAGGWGYGITGEDLGKGGTGWGTIGTGVYGTIGHGSGTGHGYGTGTGRGGIDGRHAQAPSVLIGAASSMGELDKSMIRRYVRRRLPRIQHCYEKALLGLPELEGTVEVDFQISPNGSVAAAKATGIDNAEVEDCVAHAIHSIQFPAPTDKGYVSVHYPFRFQPAGD